MTKNLIHSISKGKQDRNHVPSRRGVRDCIGKTGQITRHLGNRPLPLDSPFNCPSPNLCSHCAAHPAALPRLAGGNDGPLSCSEIAGGTHEPLPLRAGWWDLLAAAMLGGSWRDPWATATPRAVSAAPAAC